MNRFCFLGLLFIFLLGCNEEPPPSLLPIGNREIRIGQTLEIVVAAHGPNGENLQFSAEPLPVGAAFAQFAPTAARFMWSPTLADLGDTYVVFSVSNRGVSDSETVIIKVRGEQYIGPEILGPYTWHLDPGESFLEKIIEVRDEGGAIFNWRIDNSPDGASLIPTARAALFSWTPTSTQRQQSLYSFTITVTNEHDQSTNQIFSVIMSEEENNGSCAQTKPQITNTTPDFFKRTNNFDITAAVVDEKGQIEMVFMKWIEGENTNTEDYEHWLIMRNDDSPDIYSTTIHLPQDLPDGKLANFSYEICARSSHGPECEMLSCTPVLSFSAQCTPKNCEELGKNCGINDNGCGKNILCGNCLTGICDDGVCTTEGCDPSERNSCGDPAFFCHEGNCLPCSNGYLNCNGYNVGEGGIAGCECKGTRCVLGLCIQEPCANANPTAPDGCSEHTGLYCHDPDGTGGECIPCDANFSNCNGYGDCECLWGCNGTECAFW